MRTPSSTPRRVPAATAPVASIELAARSADISVAVTGAAVDAVLTGAGSAGPGVWSAYS